MNRHGIGGYFGVFWRGLIVPPLCAWAAFGQSSGQYGAWGHAIEMANRANHLAGAYGGSAGSLNARDGSTYRQFANGRFSFWCPAWLSVTRAVPTQVILAPATKGLPMVIVTDEGEIPAGTCREVHARVVAGYFAGNVSTVWLQTGLDEESVQAAGASVSSTFQGFGHPGMTLLATTVCSVFVAYPSTALEPKPRPNGLPASRSNRFRSAAGTDSDDQTRPGRIRQRGAGRHAMGES